MSLLEQQALLEPEPGRHVVMPKMLSDAGWWGVDSSTTRLNVAWAVDADRLDKLPEGDGVRAWREGAFVRGVQAVKLGGVSENEGQRLEVITGQVAQLVSAMAQVGVPAPAVVYVEHPAGQHPKPQLYYAVGCTAAALYRAGRDVYGHVPRVEFTTSGHWKKVACGKGNISKPKWGKHGGGKTWEQVRETYEVLRWARVNGYTGAERDCWDDADSLAMADCARRDVAIRF